MLKQLPNQLKLSEREVEAELCWIIEAISGLNTTEQILHKDKPLSPEQENRLQEILAQRLEHKPLQHILQEAYFYGLKLKVNDKVLIPRPETETLLEIALKILDGKENPQILEIGTGSGCISIALAHSLKKTNPTIYATDISAESLQIAKENADLQQVAQFISFEQADLVSAKTSQLKFDLLISNPPYIKPSEFITLSEEVQKEPYLALIGSDNTDGLRYYKQIAKLNIQTNFLLLELDHSRAEETKAIFNDIGFAKVELLKDLNNNWRFLLCSIV